MKVNLMTQIQATILPVSASKFESVLIFIFFLSLYLPLSRGRISTVDASSMIEVTSSIIERNSLSIDCSIVGAILGKGGVCYSKYPLGYSLIAIPFYWFGSKVSPWLLFIPPRYCEYFFSSLLSPIFTALTVSLLFSFILLFGFSKRSALFLSAVFGLATTAFPYAIDDMSEPIATLFVLAGVYWSILSTNRGDLKSMFLSGLFFGGAFFTRYVLGYIPCIVLLYLWRKKVGWTQLFVFTAVQGLFLFGLSYSHYLKFGSFFKTGYGIEAGHVSTFSFALNTWIPHGLALLISPGRGLICYSPIFLLCIMGIGRCLKNFPNEAVLFASIFCGSVLIHGAYLYWDAGWSWGPRYLMPEIPLLLPFLGFGWQSIYKRKWGNLVGAFLLMISFCIQLSAAVVSWQRYMVKVTFSAEATGVEDIHWNIGKSQPFNQWQSIYEVFAMTDEELNNSRYGGAQNRNSLSLKLPNTWLINALYLGASKTLVGIFAVIFLSIIVMSFWLLFRSLEPVKMFRMDAQKHKKLH